MSAASELVEVTKWIERLEGVSEALVSEREQREMFAEIGKDAAKLLSLSGFGHLGDGLSEDYAAFLRGIVKDCKAILAEW